LIKDYFSEIISLFQGSVSPIFHINVFCANPFIKTQTQTLTSGVNITNILKAAFTRADPKSTKNIAVSLFWGFWDLRA